MPPLKTGVGLANATVVSGSTLLHPVVVVGSSVVVVVASSVVVVRTSVVVVGSSVAVVVDSSVVAVVASSVAVVVVSSVVAVDSSVMVEDSSGVIADSVDDSIARVDVGSEAKVSVDEKKSEDSVLSEEKESDEAVVKKDKREVNDSEIAGVSIEVVKERGVSVDEEEKDKEGIEEESSGDESEVTVVVWSAGDEVNDCVGSGDDVVSVLSENVAVSVKAVLIVSAIVENWFGSVVAVSAGSSPMIWPFWHCSTIES